MKNFNNQDKLKNWKTSHPRLFFIPEKIEQLRSQIENDKTIREAWLKILQRGDNLLDADFVSEDYAENGKGQHGNYGAPSGQIQGMGATLGLIYQVIGEKRYAEKLKEALLYYGEYKRWCGIEFTRWDPPWHSELNTARFCYGYAVGYDCIYDFLSQDDRKMIAQSMIELGILPTLEDWVLPEKRVHALDSMGHNWWSVCVAMAGLAGLSILGEEPLAEGWTDKIISAFSEWFYYEGNVLQNKSRNFDKGAFYESVSYADYALAEFLLFRLACLNTFPDAPAIDIPLLKDVGNFFVNTCYPRSGSTLSANFGDSSINSTGARTVRLLRANGYKDEKCQWYLSRTDFGLGDPVGLVYSQGSSESLPHDFPKSVAYTDIGWTVMRSSWEDNATMLAVKSGFAWNHAHADAGSFILFHAGEPLIIDSGTCSYDRPEYNRYYCQGMAHNVILFNGEGEPNEDIQIGTKTPGRVHNLIDAGTFKYVYADATGPMSRYLSRSYRHFLWIGDTILVIDDVRAYTSGKIEWLLHYEGEFNITDSDINLTNGSAKAIVRPLFPEKLDSIAQKEGLKDHEPDKKIPYLSFSVENVSQAKFIVAILPIGNKDLPKIERLQSSEMIGVRIYEDGNITDVYLNLRADGRRMHRNSNNIFLGWETDAYLVAITRPEGSDENDPDSAIRYFIACGSYLRKDGKVILDSLSKVFAVFDADKPETEAIIQGQALMDVSLRTRSNPPF